MGDDSRYVTRLSHPPFLLIRPNLSASGVVMMWIECTTEEDALLQDPRITPWLETLTACTLAVNVLVTCTSTPSYHVLSLYHARTRLTHLLSLLSLSISASIALIVWRIWSVKSKSTGATVYPHRLSRVMRIILDSGLLYTVCVIIFFGTNLAGSNAQYGVSDVVVQVIVRPSLHFTSFSFHLSLISRRTLTEHTEQGITFNLIIIRVNNGMSPENNFTSSGGGTPHAAPSYPLQFMHTATMNSEIPTFHTPAEVSVEVEVTRHSDDDGESGYTTKAGHEPWKGGEAV